MPDFNVSLAPSQLTQTINPWTLTLGSLFTINLGQSSDPELEDQILAEVGSYGRQLGQIGDVMALLIPLIDQAKLNDEQKKTIWKLQEQLKGVDRLKAAQSKKS
jgi:hypothetical protein